LQIEEVGAVMLVVIDSKHHYSPSQIT